MLIFCFIWQQRLSELKCFPFFLKVCSPACYCFESRTHMFEIWVPVLHHTRNYCYIMLAQHSFITLLTAAALCWLSLVQCKQAKLSQGGALVVQWDLCKLAFSQPHWHAVYAHRQMHASSWTYTYHCTFSWSVAVFMNLQQTLLTCLICWCLSEAANYSKLLLKTCLMCLKESHLCPQKVLYTTWAVTLLFLCVCLSESSMTNSSEVETLASQPQKLLILDARSYAAAVANRAKGGGCECPGKSRLFGPKSHTELGQCVFDLAAQFGLKTSIFTYSKCYFHLISEYYPNCEVVFMGMANIHSIRKSFQSLRFLCTQMPDPAKYVFVNMPPAVHPDFPSQDFMTQR